MKKTPTLFYCFIFLLISPSLFAQETTEADTSIDAQFEALFKNSNNYKNYEVVERSSLIELQKNTRSEISGLNQKIDSSETLIASQQKEISELQVSLDTYETDLNEAVQAKEQIVFLGMPLNKTTYRIITWGIILLLAVIMFVFAYKFRSSNIETKEAKKNLAEMEDEYEEYRKTALEKQQKLGRMLQDERNKLARSGQK